MMRRVLIVVGTALLSIGGIGLFIGLVWLTTNHLNGTLPNIADQRPESMIYMLPSLFLVLVIIGAVFVAGALAIPPHQVRKHHHFHSHLRFHA